MPPQFFLICFLLAGHVRAGGSQRALRPLAQNGIMGRAATGVITRGTHDPVRGEMSDLSSLVHIQDMQVRQHVDRVISRFPDLSSQNLVDLEYASYSYPDAASLLQSIIRYVDPTYVFLGPNPALR